MNKKIYFNNACLRFAANSAEKSINQSFSSENFSNENILGSFLGKWMSESKPFVSEKPDETLLPADTFEQVLDYLKKKYYYIEAAGGLIRKEHDFLFIFRHGKWDLPKGKLDEEESTEHAAVRECEEECGIGELSILNPLSSTFHIYRYKDSFAIKQTFWYYMSTSWNKVLVPQLEEQIEKAEWVNKERILKDVFANSYFTIKDVVNEAMEQGIIA